MNYTDLYIAWYGKGTAAARLGVFFGSDEKTSSHCTGIVAAFVDWCLPRRHLAFMDAMSGTICLVARVWGVQFSQESVPTRFIVLGLVLPMVARCTVHILLSRHSGDS